MEKKVISTKNAPSAIGPYSQAVQVGNLIFISGQIPIDPATGEFTGNDIRSQTKQCLKNIKSILEAADCSMENVIKVTVLLKDISTFVQMNEVYATFFDENFPARAAFEVACLPKNALVEIEAIAVI